MREPMKVSYEEMTPAPEDAKFRLEAAFDILVEKLIQEHSAEDNTVKHFGAEPASNKRSERLTRGTGEISLKE
jgi:hypothetical protein